MLAWGLLTTTRRIVSGLLTKIGMVLHYMKLYGQSKASVAEQRWRPQQRLEPLNRAQPVMHREWHMLGCLTLRSEELARDIECFASGHDDFLAVEKLFCNGAC